MFQSNKEYIDFLTQSGVHTFLKETPNNLLEIKELKEKSSEKKDVKALEDINEINELISLISNHQSILKKTAKKLVLYDGNLQSNLMIIGEAPGQEEDERGIPFVGRAGQLLNKMLSAIKLERKNVYVTNVLPWRPPQNRNPTDQEILDFLPFLQKQIEIIKPKFIYLLGTTAAKAILSTPLSLGKLRGKWHEYKSVNLDTPINVLVSYHPAFLLRSPNHKKEAWADLQMLEKKINEN
jgi:DNA polymerase